MTSARFPPPNGQVFSPGARLAQALPCNQGTRVVKKTRNGKATYRKSELWIAPSSSLKRTGHQSDWKLRRGESDENNKYLELADIALGLAPAKHKTKRSA